MAYKYFAVNILALHLNNVLSEHYCQDINDRAVESGNLYFPGPEPCQICTCFQGKPEGCKDVLCAQPTLQTCKAYRRGKGCCDFYCVDDAFTKHSPNFSEYNQEFGVRVMIACAVTAMLFISLGFFLVYRFRWNKNNSRRNQGGQHDDQRSLASVGYIGGGASYMRPNEYNHCPVGWKPHYLPRGEAPPPYDEAIAQANAEYLRESVERPIILHRSLSVSHTVRTQDIHNYANLPTPINQMPNSRNISQHMPLLQATRGNEPDSSSYTSLHITSTDSLNFAHSARLAQSLGTINSRALLGTTIANEAPISYGGQGLLQVAGNHRTIPRASNCIEGQPQSFYLTTQHRSHPRFETLQNFAGQIENSNGINDGSLRSIARPTRFDNPSEAQYYEVRYKRNSLNNSIPKIRTSGRSLNNGASETRFANSNVEQSAKRTDNYQEQNVGTLPTTVDKPSCECSYNTQNSANEEQDDFRNECENCKAQSGSRWRSEEWSWAEPATRSLQRPNPMSQSHGVTTLPSRGPKVGDPLLPNNWESWFNSIGADTSSDED